MIDWIPIKFAPEHGQKVLVVQNPETTATREPLFAIYNGNTKRYMPPEKFYEPTDKNGSRSREQSKGKKAGKYDVHVTIHATADQILKATLKPVPKVKKS